MKTDKSWWVERSPSGRLVVVLAKWSAEKTDRIGPFSTYDLAKSWVVGEEKRYVARRGIVAVALTVLTFTAVSVALMLMVTT